LRVKSQALWCQKERDKMTEVFNLISELGFPIASAIIGGFFMFLTLKYIMSGVIDQVKSMHGIVSALDNRIKTMNHDIIRLDTTMCVVLGIRPDLNRISRADGKTDARRD
jgi:hypothetical protein